jgi:hypothetical protein
LILYDKIELLKSKGLSKIILLDHCFCSGLSWITWCSVSFCSTNAGSLTGGKPLTGSRNTGWNEKQNKTTSGLSLAGKTIKRTMLKLIQA